MSQLPFEKAIDEMESKVEELRHISGDSELNIADDIVALKDKIKRRMESAYKNLSPQEIVQIARHPERPHFSAYINQLTEYFQPLAGDRLYGEDAALIGGLARLNDGMPCVIMGHEKGHDTESRLHHNFGMARPEGYRKAQRLAKMAGQFNLPLITLVDTAGAYPGVGAEERGQSEAIARSIDVFLNAPCPVVSVIIGEGGSGGAIAIAAANRVYMQRYSIYSVISPEGCASILWRSRDYAGQAAQALKLTAPDLDNLGIIDGIIDEPAGAAHRHAEQVIEETGKQIKTALAELSNLSGPELIQERQQKYIQMGSDL
jgi:acetyl-CoA carboxylase carboxyl transferase subunit alpha